MKEDWYYSINRKRFEKGHPVIREENDVHFKNDIRKLRALTDRSNELCVFVWKRTSSISESMNCIVKYF